MNETEDTGGEEESIVMTTAEEVQSLSVVPSNGFDIQVVDNRRLLLSELLTSCPTPFAIVRKYILEQGSSAQPQEAQQEQQNQEPIVILQPLQHLIMGGLWPLYALPQFLMPQQQMSNSSGGNNYSSGKSRRGNVAIGMGKKRKTVVIKNELMRGLFICNSNYVHGELQLKLDCSIPIDITVKIIARQQLSMQATVVNEQAIRNGIRNPMDNNDEEFILVNVVKCVTAKTQNQSMIDLLEQPDITIEVDQTLITSFQCKLTSGEGMLELQLSQDSHPSVFRNHEQLWLHFYVTKHIRACTNSTHGGELITSQQQNQLQQRPLGAIACRVLTDYSFSVQS